MNKTSSFILSAYSFVFKYSLDKILEVGYRSKNGNPIPSFDENILIDLCTDAREIFEKENNILRIKGDVIVVGDIHGSFHDLLRILNYFQENQKKVLFLGDYIDRGSFSLECITIIFALKVIRPDLFFLIRGNHEFDFICSKYGFKDEILNYYNPMKSQEAGKSILIQDLDEEYLADHNDMNCYSYSETLYNSFVNTFSYLPIGAIINDTTFCIHGGLSPKLDHIDDLNKYITRPITKLDNPLLTDVVWGDPCDNMNFVFRENFRGSGFLFNQVAVNVFLKNNSLKRMIRGHECVRNGIQCLFDSKCITVFSASSYGKSKGNCSGIVELFQKDDRVELKSFPPINRLQKSDTAYYKVQNQSQNERFPFSLLYPYLNRGIPIKLSQGFQIKRGPTRRSHDSINYSKSFKLVKPSFTTNPRKSLRIQQSSSNASLQIGDDYVAHNAKSHHRLKNSQKEEKDSKLKKDADSKKDEDSTKEEKEIKEDKDEKKVKEAKKGKEINDLNSEIIFFKIQIKELNDKLNLIISEKADTLVSKPVKSFDAIKQEDLQNQCFELKRLVQAKILPAIRLPNFIFEVPSKLFENNNLITLIEIPPSVILIKSSAFKNCTLLKCIEIPSSVRYIENNAFEGCSSLANFKFKAQSSIKSIGYSAFNGCASLTKIDLPSSIETIGFCSFFGYTKLEKIKFPKKAKMIDQATFYGCRSLISIEIPESVTSIGSRAFFNCKSLKTITLNSEITVIREGTFFGCSSLTKINNMKSISSFEDNSFCGCTSLKNIKIPDEMTSIGSDVFNGCSSLEDIKIPDSIISIGNGAFKGCSSLKELKLPSSIESIGNDKFSDCTSIEDAKIPSSLKSIGEGMFKGCSSLTTVTIPLSLRIKKIMKNTFEGCTSLNNIRLPSTITEIDDSAFKNSSSLTNIRIPSSTTKI